MMPTMTAGPKPGDEKLFVQFYMGTTLNEAKTREAGHPVYDNRPFVKIRAPGDKTTAIDTFVDDSHKARFPKQWAQFEANEEQTQSGWPLREWPAMTRALCEEFAYLGVVTVEQLAGLPDGFGARVMGFHEWKRKATAALAQAKDNAYSEKLAVENDELKTTLAAQQAQIDQLGAQLRALTSGGTTPTPQASNDQPNRAGGGAGRSK